MSYWRFAAMIATSTVVMFGLMYVHTYTWDDVRFSETRALMALLMGAVMAIVMLAFMLGMYRKRKVNLAIFVTAAVVLVVTAWLVRSQATVSGLDYMQAMIPHHSIAILTSERARIEDPRVRKLADEIIEAQRKEIAEMKYLIRALERDGVRTTQASPAIPEELSAGEAARRAELATTDLEVLSEAELQGTLGPGPVCWFGYAAQDAPVAAVSAAASGVTRGVIKLHGRVAPMDVQGASLGEGFVMSSGDVRIEARAIEGGARTEVRRGEARLQIGTSLDVGYSGFYRCES